MLRALTSTPTLARACLTMRATTARGFATKYADSHEWCQPDGETAKIGISDFAQTALGDLVYVELPEVGDELEAQGPLGVVESVKAASDVYSPISGEVIEINEAVVEDPTLINSDPEGAGWWVKVKLSDTSELDGLMDEAAYAKKCEEEDH
eukprot:TRINITY_DN1065_c0_g1_i1.p1 TRINITY_DN1065_c0_g1~~TRINITY_DN1065_c0_g1_i1.p1  ORF type:complete len:151 (+),score=37.14 TRINITY_DN1065_c0_g1_i1:150-602(+)